MTEKAKSAGKPAYHHGDLRRSLMNSAVEIIHEQDIESLSLRKLADRIGVSQTAIYHHFKDKQALLEALGIEGIRRFGEEVSPIIADTSMTALTRFEAFVLAYVRFALTNPELYELMFGRTTWKQGNNAEFKKSARTTFRYYGDVLRQMQVSGSLAPGLNPLRVAQTSWATVHGICRMYNDGLAFSEQDVVEIVRYAISVMGRSMGLLTPSDSAE